MMTQFVEQLDPGAEEPNLKLEPNDHSPVETEITADLVEAFSPEERRGLYRAINTRRDIRVFRNDLVPAQVLARIIRAAHSGPSVGFMQPWDFIIIGKAEVRCRVKDLFDRERLASANFSMSRAGPNTCR